MLKTITRVRAYYPAESQSHLNLTCKGKNHKVLPPSYSGSKYLSSVYLLLMQVVENSLKLNWHYWRHCHYFLEICKFSLLGKKKTPGLWKQFPPN